MVDHVSVGLDMATDPARTAAAVVAWSPAGAAIEEVVLPCLDAEVVRLAARGTVGIDCALGWPDPFIEFLSDLRAGSDRIVEDSDGPGWRERLSMRTTDLHVHRETGHRPLSVATDRLGLVAIRTASILARLRRAGFDTARDGTGRAIEVYPGAALRLWGLDTRGYKREPEARRRIVHALGARMPWLDWAGADLRAVESDHVLDAIVAALITRAAQLGRVGTPTLEQRPAALREGWIMLPEVQPEELRG